MTDFEQTLDKYAELAVRIGLNVQQGQRVFVRASREAPEMVYRRGAVGISPGRVIGACGVGRGYAGLDSCPGIRSRESGPAGGLVRTTFNGAAERVTGDFCSSMRLTPGFLPAWMRTVRLPFATHVCRRYADASGTVAVRFSMERVPCPDRRLGKPGAFSKRPGGRRKIVAGDF